MTLQQLLYFREVAESLSFTHAAQTLYVTQSTLSHSIMALERELGVPLLVRQSGKKVSLTNFGAALMPLASQVLAEVENIEDTMNRMRNPLTGVVNVAFSYINCWRLVPQMLAGFNRDQLSAGDISINVVVNHKRRNFEDEVVQGDIDIAFSCLSAQEGLETVPFVKQQLYVALSPMHPLSEKTSLTVEDIADEPLIGYHQGRNLDRWIYSMYDQYALRPNMVNYAEDWSEQLIFAALGKGIAIMPLVPTEQGSVNFVPLDDPMSVRTVYIMWAGNRQLPPAVEYVRDYCLEYGKNLQCI